jgi:hypothetical protein
MATRLAAKRTYNDTSITRNYANMFHPIYNGRYASEESAPLQRFSVLRQRIRDDARKQILQCTSKYTL